MKEAPTKIQSENCTVFPIYIPKLGLDFAMNI